MTGAATPSHREARRWVEAYCRDRPELSICSCKVLEVKVIERDAWVFLDSPDKRCPELFLIREVRNESGGEIIPYFAIRERPSRQIVSYSLGKGLCNLAEVKELFGAPVFPLLRELQSRGIASRGGEACPESPSGFMTV